MEYYIRTTCTEYNLLLLSACVYSVGSSLQAGLFHLVRFSILVVGRGKFNYDIHKVRSVVILPSLTFTGSNKLY